MTDLKGFEEFQNPAKISIEDLEIEPFVETQRVQEFDCGNKALNDFLNTDEVVKYDEEGLGSTYLVYYEGTPVAYFTVSFGSLRIEYLKKWKSFSRLSEMKLDNVPSLKLGRLAVHKDYQSRGIGSLNQLHCRDGT